MFGIQQYTENGMVHDCTLLKGYQYQELCQLSSVSSFFIAAESQVFIFGLCEIIVCCLFLIVLVIVAIWPFISQLVMNRIPIAFVNFFETTNWNRLLNKDDSLINESLLSTVAIYIVC